GRYHHRPEEDVRPCAGTCASHSLETRQPRAEEYPAPGRPGASSGATRLLNLSLLDLVQARVSFQHEKLPADAPLPSGGDFSLARSGRRNGASVVRASARN